MKNINPPPADAEKEIDETANLGDPSAETIPDEPTEQEENPKINKPSGLIDYPPNTPRSPESIDRSRRYIDTL